MFGKEDCLDDQANAGEQMGEQKGGGMREKLLQKLIEMMMGMPDQEKKPEGMDIVAMGAAPEDGEKKDELV
jgi:hypothetical protein